MKKLIVLSVALFGLLFNAQAQAPNNFKYQAVVRDGANLIMADATVGIQMTIRQGTFDGTAVYSETFDPTTNAYGLVNLEIGTGISDDDFSTIDWADGPYFIETAIDFDGGMAFEVIGSSQLLSVPYALHAKTAEGIAGGELDPLFAESVAAGITVEDIAEWEDHTEDTFLDSTDIADLGYVAGPHTEDTNLDSTDIAELGYVAGPHIETYEIGDFAHGGVVVAVDPTGLHGLVVAIEDLVGTYAWATGPRTNEFVPSKGSGIGSGRMATSAIIAFHEMGGLTSGTPEYAAFQATLYTYTEEGYIYGDWYLPTIAEINLIFDNISTVNDVSVANGGAALDPVFYWTSSYREDLAWIAYGVNMSSGVLNITNKSTFLNVRAVRTF